MIQKDLIQLYPNGNNQLYFMRARNRRDLLQSALSVGAISAFSSIVPAYAWAQINSEDSGSAQLNRPYDLAIRPMLLNVDGTMGNAIALNGSVLGPLLRFREGEVANIRVKNELDEIASMHWHGILLPPEMDGVPGVSFAGIGPNSTFVYEFPVKQSGTYWYHSHSGSQEQLGAYGPIIIDPIKPEPYPYEREYGIILSDWTFMHPQKILKKLKSDTAYFNFQKRTVGDFFSDAKASGLLSTLSQRRQWVKMRMDSTDISDVTGATYTYLMNGLGPSTNWTGLYRPGERIRLGAALIFLIPISE